MNADKGSFPKEPLGPMFDLEYGCALREQDRSGNGYPVFGSAGVVGYHRRYLIEGPGIVVGRKGSVGEVRWSDSHFWPIDTAYYVVPKNGTHLRYLFWLLSTSDLKALDAATGVPGLNRNDVYVLKEHVAPNTAQIPLAAVLDAVEAVIEKTAAVIAKLKQARSGLIHDLLTRGLDDNGEPRDLLKHPEQFKDSPLGRIPKDWECKSLLDPTCTMWFSGGTPNRSQLAWWAGSVPFLTPKDMKVFRISDTIEHVTGFAAQHASRLMPAETVFIVVRGMILAHTFPVCLSTRPFAFNQDIKAVQGAESLSTQFLGYWFSGKANVFLRKATEATHGTKKLDMSEINRVLIACPLLAEQDLLVHRIELADNLISENQSELDVLRQLKSGLMSDLLTGRVPVPQTVYTGA